MAFVPEHGCWTGRFTSGSSRSCRTGALSQVVLCGQAGCRGDGPPGQVLGAKRWPARPCAQRALGSPELKSVGPVFSVHGMEEEKISPALLILT